MSRALVVGASGGIGRETVAALASHGFDVVGADINPDDGHLRCDVTVLDDVKRTVAAAAERTGTIDALVNIVGVSGRRLGDGPVDTCTDEAWAHVMDTNLRSVFWLCREAIGLMADGSTVVNVSSILGARGGVEGLFDTHAYAASKGGVDALTRAMAATYGSRGIRVNAVAPGLVSTPMSARAVADDDVVSYVKSRQVATGVLASSSVAAAIAFLASPASAGITGVVLPVDGGWSAT